MRPALLFAAMLFAGCAATRPAAPPAASPADVQAAAYEAAVADAAVVRAAERVETLRPVRRDTPGLPWRDDGGEARVQVVTWTRHLPAIAPGDTLRVGDWEMWVTLPPDVQNACQGAPDPAMRARQLLGLPPDADNTHFVSYWTRPADLFRPCWDAEIDDGTCAYLRPGPDAAPAHVAWMDAQTWSAFTDVDDGQVYPWTRLGYTYDWGGETPVGPSEYVVRSGAALVLAGPPVRTAAYCAP